MLNSKLITSDYHEKYDKRNYLDPFSPLSLSWKKNSLMRSPACLYVCVSLLSTYGCLNQSLWNLAYRGTRAQLNGVLHWSLPTVCMSVGVSAISLLGNGSVYTFLLHQIQETKKNCWTHRFLCCPSCVKWEYVGLSVYHRIFPNQCLKQFRVVMKNSWKCLFPCDPCRINGKQAITSSQNFLFIIKLYFLIWLW
jgi:hypothetical protein